MNERRATARVTPVEPIPVKLKSALPARVLDISSGGIQVEVATSLRPEADCELRVQLADGEMIVRAKVRRCRAWGFGLDESDRRVLLYRAGLQFADMPPEALGRLRPLIEVPAPETGTTTFPEEADIERVDPAGEPGTNEGALVEAPQVPLPQAPRRAGPVKIRINSEYVRRLLQGGEKQ